MSLSRAHLIHKLGNAIREYLGTFNPHSRKWVRPPRPEKAEHILRRLTQLNFPEPVIGLADIQEFKTFDEMRTWLSKL